MSKMPILRNALHHYIFVSRNDEYIFEVIENYDTDPMTYNFKYTERNINGKHTHTDTFETLASAYEAMFFTDTFETLASAYEAMFLNIFEVMNRNLRVGCSLQRLK